MRDLKLQKIKCENGNEKIYWQLLDDNMAIMQH